MSYEKDCPPQIDGEELSCPLEFPDAPDGRVLPPATPPFAKLETVIIRGYFGGIEGDHIRLHHAFDHRAYFRIPIEGIACCEPEVVPGLQSLYKLTIYEATPIRYYEATTVDLTAAILSEAVDLWNQQNPGPEQPSGAPPRCPVNCPPGYCVNGICIRIPTSYAGEEFLEEFGLEACTPDV